MRSMKLILIGLAAGVAVGIFGIKDQQRSGVVVSEARGLARSLRSDARAVSRRSSQSAEFTWHGEIASGDAIEIRGVNGGIRAVEAEGDEVEVHARKTSRRSDLDDVLIEVVQHSGGVTVCAVYPGRGNSCEPGGGGRSNIRNNDVSVEFTVYVPEGVHLIAHTINGSIDADGLQSDVSAVTVNGSIDISTTGIAEATTVNGSIEARIGEDDISDLEFSTVNGRITLWLPDGVDADVSARTVSGSIQTEFPLTIRGKYASKNLSGVLGDGGPNLELRTVSGSIRLLRH